MPELPEVETTRRGLEPHIAGCRIQHLTLKRRDLRWPVSEALPEAAEGQLIQSLERRGKYLIFNLEDGYLLAHLGMSGSIRIVSTGTDQRKHDHWVLDVGKDQELRFNDPRRFGSLFWGAGNWRDHTLISSLGPEPLSEDFNGDYLFAKAKGRKLAIKQLIMDSKLVVGVGNIYAAESLFHAGIHPMLSAGKLSKPRAKALVDQIRIVISSAIEKGGTTLRDYVNGSGKPGYFQQELWVYGRRGLPCKSCGSLVKEIRMGQRSSCFCSRCQRR